MGDSSGFHAVIYWFLHGRKTNVSVRTGKGVTKVESGRPTYIPQCTFYSKSLNCVKSDILSSGN